MNVSSVKNLNGETFSAVQDAELTEVVQTNSGNWQDITAYQNASATYLTAHQDISNLMPKSESANFYPMEGNPSGFLTTHQAISADEWNSNYETVNTNSGVWGGSALPVSAGQGVKINLVDNTLVFSNDETLLYESSAKWTGITFSEPASNFEKIRVYVNTGRPHIFEWPSNAFTNNYWPGDMYGCGWGAKPAMTVFEFSSNNTGFNVNGGWHTESTASVNWTVLNVSSTWVRPFKVLGINRIAGGN